MALEIEDDLFFADISKQIALLIMDDDDDIFPAPRPFIQELPYLPQTIMPPTYSYEARYRRESKGTGVFIPRSTVPRRKNRPNRSNTVNNNNKHSGKLSAVVSTTKDIGNNRFYSKY